MNDSVPEHPKQSFLSVATSGEVVIRAIKVSIVVGSLLVCINQSEKILEMSFSGQDIFKILLTYLVPYCVSTWSAVSAIRAKTPDCS